jgi:hypothetical protein
MMPPTVDPVEKEIADMRSQLRLVKSDLLRTEAEISSLEEQLRLFELNYQNRRE